MRAYAPASGQLGDWTDAGCRLPQLPCPSITASTPADLEKARDTSPGWMQKQPSKMSVWAQTWPSCPHTDPRGMSCVPFWISIKVRCIKQKHGCRKTHYPYWTPIWGFCLGRDGGHKLMSILYIHWRMKKTIFSYSCLDVYYTCTVYHHENFCELKKYLQLVNTKYQLQNSTMTLPSFVGILSLLKQHFQFLLPSSLSHILTHFQRSVKSFIKFSSYPSK